MSTSDGPDPQSSAQQRVIQRATDDPDFRAALLANPTEAIRQELNIPLPGNVSVRVVEEQPGEVILVLPGKAKQSGSSLSEADLDAVAGGGSGNSWDCSACC